MRLILLITALLLVGTACREQGGSRTEPSDAIQSEGAARKPTSADEKASSAAEGAVCKEHGVLEAVCTKCNPALIPVFQAKGDWCAEHGFPESFCPICHPEKGGRPAVDVKSDGAPADGTKVRFKTLEVARRAGIETTRAVERLDAGGIVTVARLTFDATRVAQVSARAPGVVKALKVDVGTEVTPGTPLVVIQSAELGADRSRLLAARSRLEVAEASSKREQSLHQNGIASLKEVQAAQQEWEAAKAEVAALSASIGMVGDSGGETSSYTLQAPLAGTVTKRDVSVGMFVGTDQSLLTLVDTSSLWAELDISESEVASVTVGQTVVLTFDSTGERTFSGRIASLAPELNPHTRTVLARVQLSNSEGVLRANMFGQARIAVGGSQAAVAVPKTAVQRAKGTDLVFVRLKEDEYEARRVTVGSSSGDLMILTKGIRPDEEVVTTGSFLLKTETLKDSIGAGCCDVE